MKATPMKKREFEVNFDEESYSAELLPDRNYHMTGIASHYNETTKITNHLFTKEAETQQHLVCEKIFYVFFLLFCFYY